MPEELDLLGFYTCSFHARRSLQAPYVPHPLAGVMAQNKPANAKETHVWSIGDQKLGS